MARVTTTVIICFEMLEIGVSVQKLRAYFCNCYFPNQTYTINSIVMIASNSTILSFHYLLCIKNVCKPQRAREISENRQSRFAYKSKLEAYKNSQNS